MYFIIPARTLLLLLLLVVLLSVRVFIVLYRGAGKSLPYQERNKLMFLSEWREFPSAPCLTGKKNLYDSSRLHVVEIARVPDMLPSFSPSWSG